MSGNVSEHDSESEGEEPVAMPGSLPTAEKDPAPRVGVTDWQSRLVVNANGVYTYTDPNSGTQYQWSTEKNSWVEDSSEECSTRDVVDTLKQQASNQMTLQPWEQYLQENEKNSGYTYTDPTDGTIYEWDANKRAWFPKIDDNFLAAYQAAYGVPGQDESEAAKEDTQSEATQSESKEENNLEKDNRKRKLEEKGWFDIDPEKNHNVYVSGLPSDYTDNDFVDLMSKCGIIMEDPETKKLKCKLYRDADGNFKGDGRCCYLRGESVALALQLLDETQVNGQKIHVEKAVFQLKGEYDPSRKPKKKKTKKKKKADQEKLLDWVDRDRKRSKFDRIVILKHMFNIAEFEGNPGLIAEIRDDIKSECEKFGSVKKVLVFDRNPDGVCSVLFVEPEMADECIEALNGRWFGGKRISAERYDGVTNYNIRETEEELEARMKQWEDFLESG